MKRNISQYLRDIIRGSGNRMVDIDVSIRRRVQPSQRPLEVVDPGKERIPAAQSPRQRTLTRNMFNLPWACLCQSRSASTRLVVPQYRTAADASARTRSAPTSRAAPILGSVVGGVLSDRVARRILGGHAGFMVLVIATCGPLMLAYRFVPAGSALFYIGMCAGFFLPLATYGPALALIQGLTPNKSRSTVTPEPTQERRRIATAGSDAARPLMPPQPSSAAVAAA